MNATSTPDSRFEKQAEEERLRFERIAKYSHDLIGACDMNGVPIYINPEGLRLVGLEDIQAARSTKFTDFFFPDDIAFVEQNLLRQVIQEDYGETEIRLRHFKTQEPIWMNYTVFTVRNERGEIVSIAIIGRNIDAYKKRAQELEQQVAVRTRELREANEELERMNQKMDSFAYTSSHDLQTPLRKIQAFTSRLLERESAGLSTQGREYFCRVQNATQEMQTLIKDLLAYSRTGSTEKMVELTDLNVLLAEVKGVLEPQTQDTQGHLEVGPLPTLPVVPFQFRQLFGNLIGNALKFARKDVPPRIVIRAERQPGASIPHFAVCADRMYHHLTVTDNGIGFDPIYSTRIFEVFQRLHGRNEYNGTGIGLAICKKIAEGHQGFITAEGVPGEGAAFHIYLPEQVD